MKLGISDKGFERLASLAKSGQVEDEFVEGSGSVFDPRAETFEALQAVVPGDTLAIHGTQYEVLSEFHSREEDRNPYVTLRSPKGMTALLVLPDNYRYDAILVQGRKNSEFSLSAIEVF